MSGFNIVSLQLPLDGNDNLDSIELEISAVVQRFPNTQMVLLGELSLFGAKIADNVDRIDDAYQRLSNLAERLEIWLIPGSLFERHDGQTYNCTPVFSPQGKLVTSHRKLFPFLPYEKNVSAGHEFVVFDVPDVGRFGVCICYDMWFPEVIRSLIGLGAEVILHPTMTNTIDRDIELSIARANAAMNQCYLLDINVAGNYGIGQSIICGPGGEVLHQAGAGREVITTRVDFDYLRDVRENGWNSLGQPLKSFRDANLNFPIYQSDTRKNPMLGSLGPLEKSKKPKN